MLYTYDLGDQNRDTIEVGGTGFVNHYMKVGRLDLDFRRSHRWTALPALPQLPDTLATPGSRSSRTRSSTRSASARTQYFYTYGADALEGTAIVFGTISRSKLAIRVSSKDLHQRAGSSAVERPLRQRQHPRRLSATKPITANSALSLEFDYVDQSTRLTYYSNQSYAVSAAYHIRFTTIRLGWPVKFPWDDDVFRQPKRLWSIYDSPDPCCNTSSSPTLFFSPSSRDDRRWRFGITQTFQLADNIEIIAQAQRDIVSSNLQLYGYTSNSVVLGPQIKF